MIGNPKQIVESGYDRISTRYRGDSIDLVKSPYRIFLEYIQPHLPAQANLLELGCGCGVPMAQEFARHHRVVGVDISAIQIERATRLVPDATFIKADMTALEFEPKSFDAVIAMYAIIHVPIQEQQELLTRVASWLKPDGVFLATVGHSAWTGTEADWNGAPMYWSHANCGTYIDWLEARGLSVINEEFIAEGDGGHTMLLAVKRPGIER
jgi:SAM-dependent methyltransferase